MRRFLDPPIVLNWEAQLPRGVEMATMTSDNSVKKGKDASIGGADAGAGGAKQQLLKDKEFLSSPPRPSGPLPREGLIAESRTASCRQARRCSVKSPVLVAGRRVEVWNDEHFSRLRALHDVADNFLEGLALSSQLPKISKGNAPLFTTDNDEFIVKAMGSADHASMTELTQAYVARCEQGTLLSPIYLHFRFCLGPNHARRASLVRRASKTTSVGGRGCIEGGHEDEGHEGLRWIAYIAMRNLTPGVGTWRARYDLKGCDDDKTLENEGHRVKAVHKRWWRFWYVRCLWSSERWTYWRSKQDAKHFRLPLPGEQRCEVLKLLEGDVRWLRQHGLMDYSLLVGVQRFRACQGPDGEHGAVPPTQEDLTEALASSLPTNGRPCWVHSESKTEFNLGVSFQSREELEREAQRRVHEEARKIGLDPLDWEVELVSAASSAPSPSWTEVIDRTMSTDTGAAPWPRVFNVRLLKKTRDRPVTLVTVSIIDFLQTWTVKKRVAMCAKALECNKATIPPEPYGERFSKHFVESIFSDSSLQAEGHTRLASQPIVKPTGIWSNPCYG